MHTAANSQLPLSLIVITKNEEKNIERCIRSVPFASEVLVVDSGSRDKTCEIAKRLGAKVLSKDWMGYGPQKNFATLQAKFDWIISLDADEELSEELQQEILDRFQGLDEKTGYLFPRKSKYLGRWIRYGGWYPDWQLRLYHRAHSHWPSESIHEKVKSEREQKMNSPLLHYVFENVAAHVDTNNRYSSLLAEKDFYKGKKFSYFRLVFKPPIKFFETYFLKLGFLDGLAGFVISLGAAYSIFLRIIKIWEIDNNKNESEIK